MNNELKKRFDENGIVHIENLVSVDLIDQALSDIELFKQERMAYLKKYELLVEKDRLQRVINLHLYINSLKKIFTEGADKATDIVDCLGRAVLYTSIYFEMGSQQSLHRDTPYFFTKPAYNYMGFWIALEDIDEDNGPLMAIQKSHLLGEPDLLKLREMFFGRNEVPPSDNRLFNAYNDEIFKVAKEAGLGVDVFPMKKGDAIVWNASTIHGGALHNDKSRTRKSFVMHITPMNTSVGHMQYFFQQDKYTLPDSNWVYSSFDSRQFVESNVIDFMHKKQISRDDLDRMIIR